MEKIINNYAKQSAEHFSRYSALKKKIYRNE